MELNVCFRFLRRKNNTKLLLICVEHREEIFGVFLLNHIINIRAYKLAAFSNQLAVLGVDLKKIEPHKKHKGI